MKKLIIMCALAGLGFQLEVSGNEEQTKPLQVLILTGQNNHHWQSTTQALQEVYDSVDNRFVVQVTEEPEKLSVSDLDRYDVLVSNWNSFGKRNGIKVGWPADLKKGLLKYVEQGGAFVVVHAGGSMFYDWPEFQELIGATWALKQTGHGRVHEFRVAFPANDHPVIAGLPPFTIADELWHRMGISGEPLVLATAYSDPAKGGSGKDEPVAFATTRGKGRCFNLVLGHDVQAIKNPGFRQLLLRGTEWAATGEVRPTPLDLDALASYRFGADRTPLARAESRTWRATQNPRAAKALVQSYGQLLTRAEATTDAKSFACRQLGWLGGENAVSLLVPMLADPVLAAEARRSLSAISGTKASSALLSALSDAAPEARVELIQILASRGDGAILLPHTGALLNSEEPAVRSATIAALGKIGGVEAKRMLLALPRPESPSAQSLLSEALLRCAEGLSLSDAHPIYTALVTDTWPAYVQRSAFPNYLTGLGVEGKDILKKALVSNQPARRNAALQALRKQESPAMLSAMLQTSTQLPADTRTALLLLAGEKRAPASLPVVLASLKAEQPDIRNAAITSLAHLADASTIPELLKRMDQLSSSEAKQLAAVLQLLSSPGIDEALLTGFSTATGATQRLLVDVLAARKSKGAPALLKEQAVGHSDLKLRIACLKSLGTLGTAADQPWFLERLLETSGSEQRAVSAALARVAHRCGDFAVIRKAVDSATGEVRLHLIQVLGSAGDARSRDFLINLCKASEADVRLAATRELADWPDPSPAPALLAIAAAEESDPKARILCLRGLARMLATSPAEQPGSGTLASWRQVLAREDISLQGRKFALAALGCYRGSEGLQLIQPSLQDKNLSAEAGLAAVRVLQASPSIPAPIREDILHNLLESGVSDPTLLDPFIRLGMLSNLAPGSSISSPDGLDKDGASGGDSAAIDGQLNTYWDEVNNKAEYRLKLVLPQAATLYGIQITGFQHHNYAPRDFTVHCDGKEVAQIADAKYRDNKLLISLPAIRTRTLELIITGSHGPSPAIRELEVLGLTAPSDTP